MLKNVDSRRVCCRLTILALAVPPVLLLGACSGGSSTSAGTGASQQTSVLTHSQLLSKANAICLRGDRKINRTSKRTFGDQRPNPRQLARYATQTGIPILRQMIAELHTLPVAPSDDRFNTILATAERQVRTVPPSHFGDQAFAKTDKMAHSFGLPDC